MSKVTIICNVRDDKDFDNKLQSFKTQTLREWNAVYICGQYVSRSLRDSIETSDLNGCIEVIYDSENYAGIEQLVDGDYVLFVDNEDTFSVDYCRMLMKKAVDSDAVIVASDTAYFNKKTQGYEYSNLSPFRSIEVSYDNEELNDLYDRFGQDTADIGSIYGKLIRVAILRDCIQDSDLSDPEGLYRAIVRKASRFCNIHGAYYYRNCQESIGNSSHFNSIRTPISSKYSYYEEIKKSICGSKCEVVSFDVFDTLLLRNVYEPIDLFKFLDDIYNDIFHTTAYTRFFLMRINAENVCRDKIFKTHPDYEDITLDEIYEELSKLYQLDRDKLDRIKKREIELEHEFCIQRRIGKELYDLARYAGKRIVCTSDMYLPSDVIADFLTDNGYDGLDAIYVSSETRIGKYTGHAYRKLSDWLSCSPGSIIHIGDNIDTDVHQATKNGVLAYHLPRALDLFWGRDEGAIKGSTASFVFGHNGSENDYQYATSVNLGIRCMLALVINRFYDNPFTGFNEESDFDADPYYIGYFALGMHLWAWSDWLIRQTKGYDKIHFLSRDGYVVKKVYEIMTEGRDAVPCVYTYMSRNMIALCDITCKEDLWSIREKVTISTATPQKLIDILKPGLDEDSIKTIAESLGKQNIELNKRLDDEETFATAINVIADRIDWDSLADYRKKLKDYFESIFSANECIVDAGYNGRVEAAIKSLCGIELDSFYLHAGEDKLYERENRYSFNNSCFYNMHPIVTYLVREQFLSCVAPSVAGVEFVDNRPQLRFGEFKQDKYTAYITGIIQDAAVEFATDMAKVFREHRNHIRYRLEDASRPFDYLCSHGKDSDIDIYACAEFEDDFGEDKRFNLAEYWKDTHVQYSIQKYKNRLIDDYVIFKKYYLKMERILPKGSTRRTVVRKTIKYFIDRLQL